MIRVNASAEGIELVMTVRFLLSRNFENQYVQLPATLRKIWSEYSYSSSHGCQAAVSIPAFSRNSGGLSERAAVFQKSTVRKMHLGVAAGRAWYGQENAEKIFRMWQDESNKKKLQNISPALSRGDMEQNGNTEGEGLTSCVKMGK